MHINRRLALVPILILLGGCSRVTNPKPPASGSAGFKQLAPVLIVADQFELLSLDPTKSDNLPNATKPGTFRGWVVLGKTVVPDRRTRVKLVEAFQRGIDSGAQAADCFEPRHAIHTVHEGKSVDLLICFACTQVNVLGTHPNVLGARVGTVPIDKSPEPVLDEILKKAGIPLAPK